jgi:hypothetical protein
MLGIALGAFGSFFYSLRTKTEAPGQTKQLQVDHFWRSFTNSGHSALAVFSNPRLAGRVAHGGLHYFQDDNGTKSAEPLNITYSGAGDPTSIHLLTQLFDQYRWDLNVQPGALLSWEIAENANLIFIGRPEQNPALRELPRLQEFYFKFDEGIVNAHPQPGEESIYGYSIDNYDHAVIAYIPGIHPQQNTLVLAGNSTWGSQAAVECMTKEACVAAIMDKLQIKPGQKIPYFEALLNVKINDQVPVWNTIIAVRHYPTANLSWQTPLPNER